MAAAALLSSAQGLFRGSSLAANYTLETGPARQSAVIGLWTIQKALHKNGKAVSIWTFDKSVLAGARTRVKLDSVVEILKKEVSMLTRLRHPCVLEMVEPLQETRTSLTFATEQVTGSLKTAILASDSSLSVRRGSSDDTGMNELDEIEIQKGLLQIGKALQFLHESAKLVHSNLTTEAIVINAKGDWKLSGFGLSTYLSNAAGEATRWEFPSFDRNLPQAVQKDFDYMAPEYALDETLLPANDIYSLGCVLHAIHTKAGPPFSNHGSLQSLRDNMENITSMRAGWHKFGDEVQDVLSQLLTRYPGSRMSAATFQSSRYFSSILVSTLRFLDRENFAAKPREEQASFLKGLLKVLPQFSDKVVKRKILPSLLEETRKNMLVPFLLPCIFHIGQKMSNNEFAELLLPSLKPLFAMRDPPQAMMTLLDNLPLLQAKCSAAVFRDEVLPLVYNALESDIAPLLDKVLRIVPSLSEGLDYTTVKTTFLPKITNVFSKTTSLSVKVATLNCFKSLVPILDKYTLTEKLVPLLARIKTKEPSVMVATLAVHEQIGFKCDIQALATLVLPQLWAMSITPLLSAEQFARFMATIKKLGARVEEEQSKHLAEIRRLEETSAGASRAQRASLAPDGEVDFESLVRGPQANGRNGSITPDPFGTGDDLTRFDSLSVGPSVVSPTMTATSSSTPPLNTFNSAGRASFSNPAPTNSAKAASFLGARPISSATYHARNGLAITPDSSAPSSPPLPPLQPSVRALPPPMTASNSSTSMLRPMQASNNTNASNGSNYNISLTPQTPHAPRAHTPLQSAQSTFMQPLQPSSSDAFLQPMQPSTSTYTAPSGGGVQWNTAPQNVQSHSVAQPAWAQTHSTPTAAPPGWGGTAVLQPSKKESSYDWSDLDPMR